MGRKQIAVVLLCVLMLLYGLPFCAFANWEQITCISLDNMHTYLKNRNLPLGFVRWNCFSHLGEFRQLGFYEEDYYWYSIKDETGGITKIKIDHSPDLSQKDVKTTKVTSDMENMLEIPDKSPEYAIIKRGRYTYEYYSGTLIRIYWYAGTTSFVLLFHGMYNDTQKMSNHVVDMISTDKAVSDAAFAEITKNIYKTEGIILYAVLIPAAIASGITFLVIRKKKKAAAAVPAEEPLEEPAE